MVATFVATLVLVGWYARLPELTRWQPGLVAMQFNTAVAVLLLAVALRAKATAHRPLSASLAGVVLIFALLTLAQIISGISLGIDGIAWRLGVSQSQMGWLAQVPGAAPGRMAPSSALSVTLLSVALILLATRRASRVLIAIGLVAAVAAATMGVVDLMGYLIGVPTGSGEGRLTRMALPSAVSIIVLGLGVMAATMRAGMRAALPVHRWVPVLAGGAMAAGTLLMWRAMVERDRMTAYNEVGEVADAVSRELRHRMLDRTHLLDRIAGGQRLSTNADVRAWELIVTQVTRDYPGLTSLGMADSASVLRWVGARGAQPFASPGQRLDADTVLATTLRAARLRGTTQVSAPRADGPGPKSVLLVAPVVARERTVGYVLGALSLARLTDQALHEDIVRDYGFTLHDGPVALAARPRAHLADAARWSVSVPVDSVPGRRWTLTVVPTTEIVAASSSPLSTVFLLGGLFCATLLGWIIHTAQRSREATIHLARTVNELAEENDARRAAEETRDAHAGALARAQDFRIALVRSTEDGVAAFDASGCVSEWNPAMEAFAGHTEDDVQGKMIGDLLPFLPAGEEVRLLLEALEGRRTQLADVYTKSPSGAELWLDVTVTPMLSDEGRPIGGLLVARNVTERKRVADVILAGKLAAEETSRAKSAFLARMSHELRTPLNAIIGFTNVLLRNRHGRLSPDEITYLERINANGRHLLAVINEVLDLSKIEAGRETLELAPVSIGSLVRDTVADLGVRANGASVQLTASVPAELRDLTTDRAKLKQVLINLVGNAIKFTPAEGRVTVRVLADGDAGVPTRIEVEDTGIGIPDDRLKAIFDAFEQAEDHTSRRFGGTGLGLAISRKLCELMKHELVVDSAVGRGSTFRILLFDHRSAGDAGSGGQTAGAEDAGAAA